ncbi:hypothetical protein AGMMS49992_15350 [Clostridia bacterium]|nr:hypothetical protein AGMMS49992_15350 [Clostridia bacterium]
MYADCWCMKDNIICHGEADTASLGARLAGSLRHGDAVLLYGEMGAGKSVFSRGIAEALGVAGIMPSPTFLIMIPHQAANGLTIFHMDLYRLDGAEAFYAAGLDECLSEGISLIEWPERCPGAFNKAARIVEVHISYGSNENERVISYAHTRA